MLSRCNRIAITHENFPDNAAFEMLDGLARGFHGHHALSHRAAVESHQKSPDERHAQRRWQERYSQCAPSPANRRRRRGTDRGA